MRLVAPVCAALSFLVIACASLVACAPRSPAVALAPQGPPGVATVVFFTDFQCPYCKRVHASLAPLVAERRGRVRVILKHVPLRRHPDARSAARVAICAENILANEERFAEVADAMFATDDLSEPSLQAIATQHGVDATRFAACVADPATEARIEHDIEQFIAIDGDAVPLFFIGSERFVGQQSQSTMAAALDSAIAGAQ